MSFLNRRHGWILAVSDIASGSTHKELYRTKDGGETWAAVMDALPDHIDPMGMIFRSASVGWLAAGYHGSDEMPFYRTDDAGRHWRLQEIEIPPPFQDGYGIAYPPSFFGAGRRDGLLPVRFVTHTPEGENIAFYRTGDGGSTWHLRRWLPKSAGVDAISFLTPTLGWTLKNKDSQYPTLQRTADGGRHWQTVYPR
ncbi:MAG: hypothetical protein ACRYFS_11455 [Janthinobacterium lividum]